MGNGKEKIIIMKIHFIGHILEQSGWGRAARDLIKALKTTESEITCSPVLLGKARPLTKEYSFIKELIGKNIGKADYVIQHLLPHHIQYNGSYKKNVACAMYETTNTNVCDFENYLDLVDEVWVPSYCLDRTTYTIPYPVETPQLTQDICIKELDHTYKFYTICESSRRKNIWAMVRSFFKSFIDSDNVSLIIKIVSNEMDPVSFKNKLENDLEICKKNCGLYKTPEVHFITDYWSTDQINSLHKYCDCYISSSFGESWCYPLVDALSFNKEVISSLTYGPMYLKTIGANIRLVNGNQGLYHGEVDRLNGYHTLYEYCETVDEIDLSKEMINIYQEKERNKVDNSEVIKTLSFENIGRMMCERLQD